MLLAHQSRVGQSKTLKDMRKQMTFGFGEDLAREMAVTMPERGPNQALRPADLDSQKAFAAETK